MQPDRMTKEMFNAVIFYKSLSTDKFPFVKKFLGKCYLFLAPYIFVSKRIVNKYCIQKLFKNTFLFHYPKNALKMRKFFRCETYLL